MTVRSTVSYAVMVCCGYLFRFRVMLRVSVRNRFKDVRRKQKTVMIK